MTTRLIAWLHPPESMEELGDVLERLADRGIDTVIVNFKGWEGQAKYPSKIAHSTVGREALDVFGHMVEKSHSLRMSVEAWICTYTESNPSALMLAHPECRARGREGDGSTVDEDGAVWPCPAQERVKEYELSICREMLEQFPSIDRLHLDYIRYPWSGGKMCSCKYCQEEFRRLHGFDLMTDVLGGGGSSGKGFDAFVKWRCGHIQDFVSRARDLTNQKSIGLTAAVFPYYPSILFDLGQNWVEWCAQDMLDTVYVMNYNWSAQMAGLYTDIHSHLLKERRAMLCEGLWLHDEMSTEDVHGLCRSAIDNGASGLAFFVGNTLAKMPKDILAPVRGPS